MIFRNLDSDGDWTFGAGKSNYLRDQPAILLNLKTQILEWVGDCFFNANAGIDWKNRLEKYQTNILLDDVQSLITKAYGITAVEGVIVDFTKSGVLTISYNTTTIFSVSSQNLIAQNVNL